MDIKFNKMYMTISKPEMMQMANVYLDKTQYDSRQENAEKVTIRINL